METFDAFSDPLDSRAPTAQPTDLHGSLREHSSREQNARDIELFGTGVMMLRRRFSAARITTWPNGSCTVLRTVAEQREAYAVLGDGQWVVPVTVDGFLLPSV